MVDYVDVLEREKKLAGYDGLDKVWKSYEAFDHLSSLPQPQVFNSKMNTLNSLLGGFKPGEIVVITGKSGEGKTTLARSLTYDFTECEPERHSLWFTYEENAIDLLRKFKNHGLPFFYLPIQLMQSSITWFEDRIIETQAKFGKLDAVFLDHLSYVVPPDKYQNMSIIIGQAMREFVRIAHDYHIVLFLMAHIRNIEAEKKAHKEDIRDSSYIVQESNTVLVMRRIMEHHDEYEKDNPNRAVLSIEKNRREGNLKSFIIQYHDGRFIEETTHE